MLDRREPILANLESISLEEMSHRKKQNIEMEIMTSGLSLGFILYIKLKYNFKNPDKAGMYVVG